jgi:hypothetical protein
LEWAGEAAAVGLTVLWQLLGSAVGEPDSTHPYCFLGWSMIAETAYSRRAFPSICRGMVKIGPSHVTSAVRERGPTNNHPGGRESSVPFPNVASNQLHAFIALLVAAVVSIMIFPLFLPDTAHLAVERLMVAAILILALWAAGIRPRVLLLFAPVVVAYLLVLNLGGLQFRALAVGIRASFFAYATVLIVLHTVRARTVTGNTIAGAACAYLLAAMTWANFYEILELLRPGSFDIPANFLLPPSGDPSFAFQYFSFTTLTTVGYGDIHPTTIRAGGLAIGEAVVGQLYVAIMIARLVGLQLVQKS